MSKALKPWALVTGAGGFIGHHLVSYLKAAGYRVRGVDIKRPEYSGTDADEFMLLDLRELKNCQTATAGMDLVYQLAADMGGIGYITGSHAEISYNNSLINLYMLEASRRNDVKRFLFSSSACVYPQGLQTSPDVAPLREEDAFPAVRGAECLLGDVHHQCFSPHVFQGAFPAAHRSLRSPYSRAVSMGCQKPVCG